MYKWYPSLKRIVYVVAKLYVFLWNRSDKWSALSIISSKHCARFGYVGCLNDIIDRMVCCKLCYNNLSRHTSVSGELCRDCYNFDILWIFFTPSRTFIHLIYYQLLWNQDYHQWRNLISKECAKQFRWFIEWWKSAAGKLCVLIIIWEPKVLIQLLQAIASGLEAMTRSCKKRWKRFGLIKHMMRSWLNYMMKNSSNFRSLGCLHFGIIWISLIERFLLKHTCIYYSSAEWNDWYDKLIGIKGRKIRPGYQYC